MAKQLICVGVDPGPTPGVGCLRFDRTGESPNGGFKSLWKLVGADIYQLAPNDTGTLIHLVELLLNTNGPFDTDKIISVERFVRGRRSAKVSDPKAVDITLEQIESLRAVGDWPGIRLSSRSASEVKPWATEARLLKAGFKLPKGMTHGIDGARHCLFAAVADGEIPDPLSKAWNT